MQKNLIKTGEYKSEGIVSKHKISVLAKSKLNWSHDVDFGGILAKVVLGKAETQT